MHICVCVDRRIWVGFALAWRFCCLVCSLSCTCIHVYLGAEASTAGQGRAGKGRAGQEWSERDNGHA